MVRERAAIAVIGAGPKAAALAARVAAIHQWQSVGRQVGAVNPSDVRPAPQLHIFERSSRAGAHWDGGEGYTDGQQEVCTPPERDLVYPERYGDFGKALDLTPFAWRTYATKHGVTGRPSHRDLARYIGAVIGEAMQVAPDLVHLHLGTEVRALRRRDSAWEVTTRAAPSRAAGSAGGDALSPAIHPVPFDGVVVTSPGEAFTRRLKAEVAVRARIFDARTYWSSGNSQIHQGVQAGDRIAVLGAGGAAAAVCLDILRRVANHDEPGGVVLIAPQATLFTRGASAFETELLTSPSWSDLSREVRQHASARLISGVVFARVLDQLEALEHQPELFVGRALAAARGSFSPIELWCLSSNDRVSIIDASWVVDATGFDPLWFLTLLDERLQLVLGSLSAAVLSEHLDPYLRLHVEAVRVGSSERADVLPTEPGLHVPFLAGGSCPPGYASLLQLGALAEQILRPYLR